MELPLPPPPKAESGEEGARRCRRWSSCHHRRRLDEEEGGGWRQRKEEESLLIRVGRRSPAVAARPPGAGVAARTALPAAGAHPRPEGERKRVERKMKDKK